MRCLWGRQRKTGTACRAPTGVGRTAWPRSAGPKGAVVPVDAVAAVGHESSDDRARPIRGELVARIPRTRGARAGLVGQSVGVAAAANIATLRAVAAAVPGAFDSRTAPASSSSVVAALPVGAVGPI